MAQTYTPVGWKNKPNTDTPINADNLKHMDDAILDLYEGGATTNDIAIQDTEPTDPDVKLWIDTGEVGSQVSEITNSYSESVGLGYSANYANNLHTYSNDEVRIGTYLGKPLYRKIVNGTFGTVTQDTQSEVEIQIPNADFLLIDKYWIDRRIENNAINQGFAPDVIYIGYTSFINNNAIIRLRTKQEWVSNNSVYAIVLYTKSTD